jgi:peroxiredoxin
MSVIGSHLRPFDLPSTLGDRLTGDQCVGRSLAIIFYLQDGNSEDATLLSELNALFDQFDARGIRLIAIGIESIESHSSFAASLQLRFPLLADGESHIRKMFAAPSAKRTTLFLDPSLRVVRAYQDYDVHGHAKKLLDDAIAHLDWEPPRDILQHAPVLLIPNVLPSELCQGLISLWETQNEDSGFMKQIDGQTVGVTDYGHKIRRDHYLKSGPDEDAIKPYIVQRVIPEIHKAFNYNVTRREDFRIAGYDADRGGYFRPHRDNTTSATAHRRVAIAERRLRRGIPAISRIRIPPLSAGRRRGGHILLLAVARSDRRNGRATVCSSELFLRRSRGDDARAVQSKGRQVVTSRKLDRSARSCLYHVDDGRRETSDDAGA